MENQKIAVYLDQIHCISDTDERKHDDIYFHLYAYKGDEEEDLGHHFWENPLKLNENGDSDAYVNLEVGINTEYVDKLRISMRDKDTKSDSDSAEANSSNWQLIEDIYLDRTSKLEGELDFQQQSGNKNGHYTLTYRIIDKPIPTVRVLGVYCEQNTQKDDGKIAEAVLDLAEEACEEAAKKMHKSPRPRAQVVAEGFKAASYVFKGLQGFSAWIGHALEGDDDVYMQRTIAGAAPDGGNFFPPSDSGAKNYKMHKVEYVDDEPQYVPGENVCFFLEEYGEYSRIPLDEGDVTIQLKDSDRGADDAIGAITITEADYERLKDEGAQLEVASEYYDDKGNGYGAVYYICYSVGMEDWSSNPTPEDQGEVPEDWGVKLYPYQNQQGIPLGFAKGAYNLTNTTYNNQVESLAIQEGHQVMLYTTPDWSGAIRLVTSSQDDLGGWNNQISSIVVQEQGELPPQWATEVFKDKNYSGSHVWLTEGYYDHSLSNFENKISSIKLNTGYYAIAYTEKDPKLPSGGFILDQSESDLSVLNVNLNDDIERLYILEEGVAPDGVAARTFSEPDYSGFSQILKKDTYYHSSGGHYDTSFKSLYLESGYQITLYENSIFNSPCITYTENISNLHQPDGFENEFRIEDTGTPVPDDWIAKCYTQENYQGHMMVLPEGEFNFQGFFNAFNNKIKSIELREDYQVALYADQHLNGTPEIITESQPSLGDLNSKVSSVKVNMNPDGNNYYIAQIEINVDGVSTTINLEDSDYWLSELVDSGTVTSIHSVKVQEGYTAHLFINPKVPGHGSSYLHTSSSGVSIDYCGDYKFISISKTSNKHIPNDTIAMIYHEHPSGYEGWFFNYPEGNYSSSLEYYEVSSRCCSHRIRDGYVFKAYSELSYAGSCRTYEGTASGVGTEHFSSCKVQKK